MCNIIFFYFLLFSFTLSCGLEASFSSSIEKCLFCRIAQRIHQAPVFWETDKHVAFLSIYPNTRGSSVVIPRKHFSSYVFDLDNSDITDLVLASKQVAKILDSKFNVARTALIFEGFGVDHVHSKLFPLHGTDSTKPWAPILSTLKNRTYFSKYVGYVSSHDGERADDLDLHELAKFLSR